MTFNRKIKVLNLFSYTGAATMACSSAGADVVQVDASKGMTEWAKENMKLCGLEDKYIRFIVDLWRAKMYFRAAYICTFLYLYLYFYYCILYCLCVDMDLQLMI